MVNKLNAGGILFAVKRMLNEIAQSSSTLLESARSKAPKLWAAAQWVTGLLKLSTPIARAQKGGIFFTIVPLRALGKICVAPPVCVRHTMAVSQGQSNTLSEVVGAESQMPFFTMTMIRILSMSDGWSQVHVARHGQNPVSYMSQQAVFS